MEENITPVPVEELETAPAETVMPPEPEEIPAPQPPKLGMKWHGFLCFWLSLWGILGILTSIAGVVAFSLMLDTMREMYTPALLVCQYARLGILLVSAILMLLAWTGLSHFRKGSPRFYIFQYGLYVVLSNILNMVAWGISGQPVFNISVVTSLIIAGVFLWLNHIYFRKRAHLYIN